MQKFLYNPQKFILLEFENEVFRVDKWGFSLLLNPKAVSHLLLVAVRTDTDQIVKHQSEAKRAGKEGDNRISVVGKKAS